jgi:GNAT superfamily N-acetyltransferase
MIDEVVIEMMTGDFILWRCLHGGPLSKTTIELWPADSPIPLGRYCVRNKPLIKKLTRIYGPCAVEARRGDDVVGHVRFYPKAVLEMDGAGFLCLQMDSPEGPRDNFSEFDFPPREKLKDQTLKIHCLMTAPPSEKDPAYRRQGIGTRMVRRLIGWATENGWKQIEADAFEDLPIIYQVTGAAGRMFWEKLGFNAADRFPNPHLRQYPEFARKLEEQAGQLGIDKEKAKDIIVMRLVLL